LANKANVAQLADDIKKGNLTEEVLRNASLLGINVRNGESSASHEAVDSTDPADADSITFKNAEGQNIGIVAADGKLNTAHPLYDYIKQNPTGTYFFGENYRRFNPNSSIKEDFFYRNGRLHKATDSEIINSGDYIN
jgi:hypothetical protein